jgi:ATP adenylyltransferase
MPDEKCTFCSIYAKRIGIIYESRFFFSQFDIFPVSPGHAEVVPKRHVTSLFDLDAEEVLDLYEAIKNTREVIVQTNLKTLYEKFSANPLNDKSLEFCKRALGHRDLNRTMDACNIGINEGEAAGRTVHHLHVHIIPRYKDDVADPVGGIRHIIPGMGNYRK